jgi:phosphoketolase
MESGPQRTQWEQGHGVLRHTPLTRLRIEQMVLQLLDQGAIESAEQGYGLLAAADKLCSAAMWLVVHLTYANRVDTSGAALTETDFKTSPQGHTGGSLNMVPAYVGYLLANALTGSTRSWLMGQGHCVAAIEAANVLCGNLSPSQQGRYELSDAGLSQLARDFYSYAITDDGLPGVPLGSHVNVNTAGGVMEGGYLGFAETHYVHMPLPGESLAVFLSDGAFEEQRGGDWAARWWRAEDSGHVMPIMILNGRRIEQRTAIVQQGGAEWLKQHLRLNGFDPFEIDGHDPAAYAWALLHMEQRLSQYSRPPRNVSYPVPLPHAIATCIKGYGFPGAGTNAAHNLPLPGNPRHSSQARQLFIQGSARLFVPLPQLQHAVATLNNHAQTARVRERDHPLARRHVSTPVLPVLKAQELDARVSPMHALDDFMVALIHANPGLRVRVGNPDELASNKMGGTLNLLGHRVSRPEPGAPESVLGSVITALNEEAVAGAALGNKGGLNLLVSYEAFALKMLGALRQDILFARHQREQGCTPGWLGVPVLLTSHTWENGKNEQSHQDPGLSELLLAEMSDTARVLFPIDATTAVAALRSVYASHGIIAALVVPKQELPVLCSATDAARAIERGVIDIVVPQEHTDIQLVALGAYQVQQVLRAHHTLARQGVVCRVTAIIEPGRLRQGRDPLESAYTWNDDAIAQSFPQCLPRVLVCHGRPDYALGLLRRLDSGPGRTCALGYLNRGGTFDTEGMFQANRCSWQHIVAAATDTVQQQRQADRPLA